MNPLRLPQQWSHHEEVAAPPYRRGQRIHIVGPDGVWFLVRVERIVARTDGCFTLVAAVRSPRRYRSHLLTTTVDAHGVIDAGDAMTSRRR